MIREWKVGDEVKLVGTQGGCGGDNCKRCIGNKYKPLIIKAIESNYCDNRNIFLGDKHSTICHVHPDDLQLVRKIINLKKIYKRIKDDKV